MELDIKAKIEELVKKITSDKTLLANFKKEPIKVVEKLICIDLPDEKIKALVDGVKAKINLDELADKAGDIKDVLGGLFGKKN